jgi:hypothetical protein
MEQFTKDNGRMMSVMGMEHRSGQMVPNMRATGKITRLMDEASFGTSTEMSLMVIEV